MQGVLTSIMMIRKNPWDNFEYREKMKSRRPSRHWLGKNLSNEHKEKLSESHKGIPSYSKGKSLSTEHKEKIRLSLMGNQRRRGKQRPVSQETRRNISAAHKGEKSRFWRGGITPLNKMIRNSFEYKLWRDSVYLRDNFACVWCQMPRGWHKSTKRRVVLHADHIKPFALFPELRFAIDNGRTLCEDCHKKTDTYGGRTKS